jgi:hypothetical protein
MANSRPYRASHGTVLRDIDPGDSRARILEPISDDQSISADSTALTDLRREQKTKGPIRRQVKGVIERTD